ncbi:MAG: hypothetical protein D6738_05825 [Acidobacteria bacterium]|nr:MAG: hypothetical protein D6738_05825 [Acidobacteriota bacterium]
MDDRAARHDDLPAGERLAALPDALRARRPAGQVLVYAGQVPLSLFVVVDGAVRIGPRGPDGRGVLRRAHPGRPLVLPPPRALGEPAACDVVLADESEIVFIPRGALGDGQGVLELVESGAIEALPLDAETA